MDECERIPHAAGPPGRPEPLTRRRFLRGATGLVLAGAGALAADRALVRRRPSVPTLRAFRSGSGGQLLRFRSRPDLSPPAVATAGTTPADTYLLLGPGTEADRTQQGPMIVNGSGELVWFRPLPPGVWATNVTTSAHRGQPVLVWWEGKVIAPGFGRGEAVILDTSYREIGRVRAAAGRTMDLHEFRITPQGTALFTCYPRPAPLDLTSLGGPADGHVLESIFQEVDLTTGRLLLEWRSLDHVPVADSYKPLSEPFDYLHLNSVDVMPDGNLLVSARHTWALYKLDRHSGRVIWRLGGKRSDFAMGDGTRFSWQHDARVQPGGEISLFDDRSDGPSRTGRQSRGLLLTIDPVRRRVDVARSYRHPRSLLASAMGSLQTLPDGGVVVGWGTAPYASEFDADGTLVADAEMPPSHYSYRAYRAPWRGTPEAAPVVTVAPAGAGQAVTAYVSWNGATGVDHWRVLRGSSPRRLTTAGRASSRGFETAVSLRGGGWLALSPIDRHGRELARSHVVRL